MPWNTLPVDPRELHIATVLRCGQSFRWKSSAPEEWSCSLNGRILSLRQDPTHLHYRSIFPETSLPSSIDSAIDIPPDTSDDTPDLLRDYFNLSVDLTALYKHWSSRDPNFSKKAPKFAGIRMLRQDPWENVVSFICSSNNNIARIGQMVDKLCLTYGQKLGSLQGVPYHDFPPPSALTAPGVEQTLRELGFGYRAKYIYQTALKIVNEKPEGWLNGLRKVPYKEAHESLLELSGVGPKVADCVCLMSLDKTEAVPVDTHVWQIAQRDYKFGKGKHKSLTKATYDAIGDHFRGLWGDEAGWAHSVLFTADLRSFSDQAMETTTATKITTTTTKKRKIKAEASTSGDDTDGDDDSRPPTKVKVKKETATTKSKKSKKSNLKLEADEAEAEITFKTEEQEEQEKDKNIIKLETQDTKELGPSPLKKEEDEEEVTIMTAAERVKRRSNRRGRRG